MLLTATAEMDPKIGGTARFHSFVSPTQKTNLTLLKKFTKLVPLATGPRKSLAFLWASWCEVDAVVLYGDTKTSLDGSIGCMLCRNLGAASMLRVKICPWLCGVANYVSS
jgi:hypothetical protein